VRVHGAAEDFLNHTPNPDIEALKPVESYVTAMIRTGARPEAEVEITLTENFEVTTWFAKDAWLRAKIDVLITPQKDTAKLFDWKTGAKVRHDPKQLRLNAAMLSVYRPQYELFEGRYIWTAHNKVTSIAPITKPEIPAVWQEFLPIVENMKTAWERDFFPARPSGLCPWCAVENCRSRRGQRRI